MKKGIVKLVPVLLSFSILSLSGCGATPLGNRNVAHQNTKNVVYTKHGKISGTAANFQQNVTFNPDQGTSSAGQRSWSFFWHQYSNAPTNLTELNPNSPSAIPNQPGSQSPSTINNSSGEQPTSPNPSTQSPSTVKNQAASQPDTLSEQVIQLVNTERKNRGLQPLQSNSSLINMANLKAEDMLKNNYFSHASPTYGSPFDMMKQLGITYTAAGENIAEGQTSAQQVMTDWMNSPGHRANILNPDYTQIGVGHSSSKNIWVQEFIKK